MKRKVPDKSSIPTPFWNDLSKKWSDLLWLPEHTVQSDHETSSWFTFTSLNPTCFIPDTNVNLAANVLEKHQEDLLLNVPKKKRVRINPRKKTAAPDSNQDVPLKTRKYKLYPTYQEKMMFAKWFGHYRWIYNRCIDAVRSGVWYTKHIELRHLLINDGAITRKLDNKDPVAYWINPDNLDLSWVYKLPAEQRDYALDELRNAYSVNNAKRQHDKNHTYTIKYKSKKDRQAFKVSARTWNSAYFAETEVAHYWLTQIKCAEKFPDINHTVSYCKDEHGDYWICVSTELEYKSENQAPVFQSMLDGIVSCDPGIRTFQTTYDPSGRVTEWGKGDIGKIVRLCYHMDNLQSKLMLKAKEKSIKKKQRHRSIRNMKQAMKRMRRKIKNLIKEIHCKTVNWLLANHKVILLPSFNTSHMVRRGTRKIGSKTARKMMAWSHFKFKERLQFKQQEYRWSKVIIVDEAYTSKTCTRCGKLNERLGGNKIFKCNVCKVILDRDIGGARNILIRYLTEHNVQTKAAVRPLLLNNLPERVMHNPIFRDVL